MGGIAAKPTNGRRNPTQRFRQIAVLEHLDAMRKQEKPAAESSELWQRAFRDEGTNANVQRLVTSLRCIRENAKLLTSRIAGSLPGLTIHDISHVDALWEVASTVAGPDYPLNPLEAYVFGASVLLHDAGLCFEAYSGGRDALRATVQWRDAHGRLSRLAGDGSDLEKAADLETLRALHASRARHLATDSWMNEEGELYLIDDRNLRENYGALIGELASSHHWDLEMVKSHFETPTATAAFLESDWVVDSLKVACLLRVADAGHMDGARAPSFLTRVLQMNSVSKTHWDAQKRLGRLAVRPDDEAQLMITSTGPFPQAGSAAWWVAFDLIETFDRELRQCNTVLGASPAGPRRPFARKSVAGASQVTELIKYVKTDGWEPTDSTVHVSDVGALVTNLGGEQLYGKDADRLYIALRELIQNAADAIGVRRSLPGNGKFPGCIFVRLKGREDGGWILQVDDNGVGMSQTTLTTDLLDFGRSFWASERAAREFPGVHASGYTPTGRFGIGFFSIFMAATKVNVFSRRFDKGLDAVRCLTFENGISLRPTLSSERPPDFGMDLCTRVELELKPNVVCDPYRITIRCSLRGHDEFAVGFGDYVGALVAGVDVPVFVESNGKRRKVHEGFPPTPEKLEEWLETLSYLRARVNERVKVGLKQAIPRLREIRDGTKCYGLAAIDVLQETEGVFLSSKAVGGLVNPHGRLDASFVGLIDHLPGTARRDPGEMTPPQDSLTRWATEQIALLRKASLSFIESMNASYSICNLGFDPIDVLQGLLLSSNCGIISVPFGLLADRLRRGWRLGFPVSRMAKHHLDSHSGQLKIPGVWSCVVIRNGKFNDATLSSGVPSEPNSLIGVVHRALVMAGENPTWSRHENAYTVNLLGPGDILEVQL